MRGLAEEATGRDPDVEVARGHLHERLGVVQGEETRESDCPPERLDPGELRTGLNEVGEGSGPRSEHAPRALQESVELLKRQNAERLRWDRPHRVEDVPYAERPLDRRGIREHPADS